MNARPLLLALAVLLAGCSSIQERDGHHIFNPLYLFYLENPRRDRWQKPDEVLDALQVQAGQVIADVGAGGGYFTERFAQRLGPTGRVYATDVQPVMWRKLRERVAAKHLANVTVVEAAYDDPTLTAGACDLVFLSSVYKEISERPAYMRKVIPALKPGGRVAIIEYRPETRAPGPPRKYRLSPAQVIAEMQAAGFHLVAQHEFLEREYFLVFQVTQ
jgi:predicted methyltransferase